MKKILLAALAAFTLFGATTANAQFVGVKGVNVQVHWLHCLAATVNGCTDSVVATATSARTDTSAAISLIQMLPIPAPGGSTTLNDSTFLFRFSYVPGSATSGAGTVTIDSLQWKHQFSHDGVNWSLDDPPGFLGYTPVAKMASRAYALAPSGLVSAAPTTAMLIPNGIQYIRFIVRRGAGVSGECKAFVTFYTADPNNVAR
jgi:hypothetical protein